MASLNDMSKWALKKLEEKPLTQKELVSMLVRKFMAGHHTAVDLISMLAFTADKVRLEIKEGYVWVSLGVMTEIESDEFLVRLNKEQPII